MKIIEIDLTKVTGFNKLQFERSEYEVSYNNWAMHKMGCIVIDLESSTGTITIETTYRNSNLDDMYFYFVFGEVDEIRIVRDAFLSDNPINGFADETNDPQIKELRIK